MSLKDKTLNELWELFPIIFVDYDIKFEKQYLEEEKLLKKLLDKHIKRISQGVHL